MNSLVIFCAQYLIFVIVLFIIICLISFPKQQKIKLVLSFLITAVVAFILAKIGSAVIYDPRPFVSDNLVPLFTHAPDNGFPSDHTLFGASIAVALFLVSKRAGVVAFILTLIVGLSRVAAHVHHLTDIIGSIIFAIIGGVVAYFVVPKIMELIAKRKRPVQSDTTRAE